MAVDPKVRGLFLEVRSIGAGPAVLSALRDVLSEIRAAGKDVIAYLPHGADNRALYLASAARLVLVGPETTVAPLGFAAHGRYVRSALSRIGVEPEVFAKGMYKSAGESLVRDTMSDAQREQLGALLETHHDALVTALAQGRNVAREVAVRWIDEAPHSAARASPSASSTASPTTTTSTASSAPSPSPTARRRVASPPSATSTCAPRRASAPSAAAR